jgi:hypothetical protein
MDMMDLIDLMDYYVPMKLVVIRILVDCLIFICAIIAPWWLTLILALCAALYFKNYFELVAAGLVIDSIYGVPRASFFYFQYIFTAGTFIIFLIFVFVKSRLRTSIW